MLIFIIKSLNYRVLKINIVKTKHVILILLKLQKIINLFVFNPSVIVLMLIIPFIKLLWLTHTLLWFLKQVQ